MATRRSGDGRRVNNGGLGSGGGNRKWPLTQKSTNVSTNVERWTGRSSHILEFSMMMKDPMGWVYSLLPRKME